MIKKNILKNLYSSMLRIRLIEEELAKKYNEKEMRCPTHFSIGQELVGGLISIFIKKNDYAISTHRCHAHYLGKGGNLNSMIAEIYGKKTGCSRGRGGSMHLIDENVSFVGSTAIVGNNIPIGVGLALGLKLDNSNNISCVFMGDGAIEEGVFFESVNFSSVQDIPVLFICENNLYSVYSPLKIRQPKNRKIYKMVESLGIKSFIAKSEDLAASINVFREASNYVRNFRKPAFFEISSYRLLEHCGPENDDSLSYRPINEVKAWKLKDPLKILEEKLLKKKIVSSREKINLFNKINLEIQEAINFAKNSDFPNSREAFIDEYA